MQALCKPTQGAGHVACAVCGAAYDVLWSHKEDALRPEAMALVAQALEEHHADGGSHPETAFNVPAWTGPADMSGAALLGYTRDTAA